MNSTAPRLRYRFVATSLVCVCFCAGIARGQNSEEPKPPDFPGLDIQAVPGWDGYVDASAPMPFSFLISNFSQDTIEGKLTLTDPENDRTVTLGEIFIGQNSVRRFSSIQALPDWFQCIAKFSHEGRILWQRELALTTGRDFSEDVNYLLFVDDGSRMLQLPVSENGSGGNGRFTPDVGYGRVVQPLAVRTWQIPQHPGPLTVAQAIVFSETTKVDMLNDAQWDAVGKWICMGGTVFVAEKSTDCIDRLKKATPLAAQPEILFEELTVHRCGTGSIRKYAGPLFSATDDRIPRQIAESASHLARYNAISMLESAHQGWWQSRNSDITRMWVVTVFVIYTLLSSSAIFLFRLSRRNIIIFTSGVVGLTCMAAVILGGFLRTSRGDLCWVTVTSAGPGGLLQLGKIEVQSAGGRNTQMTIQGPNADLQLSESDETRNDYYGYYYDRQMTQPHFPAITWQSSQLMEEADAYQISVAMNPWGRRRLYASAFQPLEGSMDIEIAYHSPDPLPMKHSEGIGAIHGLNGTFKITATSHFPYALRNCHVLIASPQASSAVEDSNLSHSGIPSRYKTQGKSILQFEQFQSSIPLGTISPSVPVSVDSVVQGELQDSEFSWNHGKWPLPQVAYNGATGIWIVGEISHSPILSVDEQRSDFEPLQERHLYVQEILPEQMPPEWLELTQRLLKVQLQAAEAAAEAAAKSMTP